MAIADGSGVPRSVCIADGSQHDVSLVEQTLDASFTADVTPLLIGDKAFDSRPLAARLATEREVELLAPRRGGRRASRRRQDGRKMRRYRRRWRVECLFAWLKRWRRICTRWEGKAENYLGFIQLGCLVILLRHL
jgi:transposase